MHDPTCGALSGDDALELIERTLSSIRLPTARFGEPAVYIGTVDGAVGIPFQAVRIIALAEGTLPGVVHDNPVLPEGLRQQLPDAVLMTNADHVLADLHALDCVVRNARASIALSAPRVGIGRTDREPSSIFIEAAATLRRPNVVTGERKGPIPDAVALRRDGFGPGRQAAEQFRLATPLSPAAWLDRAAIQRDGLPRGWRGSRALDLDEVRRLSTAMDWTSLDGVIDSGTNPVLPGLSPELPISASRLRTLLECPHRFLFEHVIGWSQPASPPSLREIDALPYGSLFHRVAESFFRQHGRAFGERQSTLADWQVLAEPLVDEAFNAFCQEYPLVGSPVRRQQHERLRRDVRSFLAHDWETSNKRTFVAVEQAFGTDIPVALHVGDMVLYLRGYIDRIDIENGHTLVRDLKTGRPHPRRGKETEAEPGRDVQIAIYGMIARQLAAQWAIPSTIEAAYAYADARGDHERAFRSDFDKLEASAQRWLSAAAGLLADRIFPRTPLVRDCEYCPFEPVCGRRPTDRAAQLLVNSTGSLAEFRVVKGSASR
jgi:RecB family exonuclease